MCGVYPDVDASSTTYAGDQISSTYEGRHLTMLEGELVHPYIADGFVNKGDPVILCTYNSLTSRKNAVGVAFNSGSADTDQIAIDTEGIWRLYVYADDDDGTSAITPGDPLFIHDGSDGASETGGGLGDATISKRMNIATQIPFGYALGAVGAGLEGTIAVKVHWQNHYQNDGQIRKTIDVADPSALSGAYAAAFKFTIDSDIAQTDGRLCAMSINMNPGNSLAAETIVGAEVCTYIGNATAVAHTVNGLFVEVQGGLSIASDWNGLFVYSAPGANVGTTAHVVRLESNPGTKTWQDSFINFVGDPNFTFYHSGQGTAGASTGTHTTGQAGFLLVNMGGATRYIALYTS